MKRIFIVLVMILSLLPFSTPAQSHVNTCDKASYAPKVLTGTRLIRGQVRWYCPPPQHHSYQKVEAVIQYKVVRRGWPDYWRGIPPSNATTTRNMNGSLYVTVECANGTQEYRTQMRFTMIGDQGSRYSEKNSYTTTRKC